MSWDLVTESIGKWGSTCLACLRPWIPSPEPQRWAKTWLDTFFLRQINSSAHQSMLGHPQSSERGSHGGSLPQALQGGCWTKTRLWALKKMWGGQTPQGRMLPRGLNAVGSRMTNPEASQTRKLPITQKAHRSFPEVMDAHCLDGVCSVQ